MPEGDSVAGNARELSSVLVDREIDSVYGTSASVRASSGRLLGKKVTDIRSRGKNLLIDFEGGWTIWVHLGMTGRWWIDSRLDQPPGDAKLALSTSDVTAICRKAPTVEVGRTPAIDRQLDQLGPDVLDEGFEPAEVLRRARLVQADRSIAEVILDQRVVAGIGNVYKSEILYLEKINPKIPASEVDDEAIRAIAQRAVRLMVPNVGRSRSTTGDRRPGGSTWVYGRGGKVCRRCGSRVMSDEHGGRYTYWCPGCQPA